MTKSLSVSVSRGGERGIVCDIRSNTTSGLQVGAAGLQLVFFHAAHASTSRLQHLSGPLISFAFMHISNWALKCKVVSGWSFCVEALNGINLLVQSKQWEKNIQSALAEFHSSCFLFFGLPKSTRCALTLCPQAASFIFFMPLGDFPLGGHALGLSATLLVQENIRN